MKASDNPRAAPFERVATCSEVRTGGFRWPKVLVLEWPLALG